MSWYMEIEVNGRRLWLKATEMERTGWSSEYVWNSQIERGSDFYKSALSKALESGVYGP